MIRLAQISDIESILKLLSQVAQVHHDIRPDLFKAGTTKYNYKDLEEIINHQEITPIFVYVENNPIGDTLVVGYAFCIIEKRLGGDMFLQHTSIYIDDICVDQNKRHKGIGCALYNHVVEHAHKLGCHNITLNVWEGNNAAMAFYKKMGMHAQKTCMEIIIK